MEKHIAHDNIVKELDIMISRINGLEASSTDEYTLPILFLLQNSSLSILASSPLGIEGLQK